MSPNICNMPEDLLRKQVIIECIPDCMLLLILTICSAIIIAYWNKWRTCTQVPNIYRVYAIVGILTVLMPLWYKGSTLIVNILTSTSNTEYAAIAKFNANCGVRK